VGLLEPDSYSSHNGAHRTSFSGQLQVSSSLCQLLPGNRTCPQHKSLLIKGFVGLSTVLPHCLVLSIVYNYMHCFSPLLLWMLETSLWCHHPSSVPVFVCALPNVQKRRYVEIVVPVCGPHDSSWNLLNGFWQNFVAVVATVLGEGMHYNHCPAITHTHHAVLMLRVVRPENMYRLMPVAVQEENSMARISTYIYFTAQQQHSQPLHSAHTSYLCVVYDSHNKQWLFP
jgi:hypothetical protein